MKSMLVLVFLAGCLQSHDAGVEKLASSDCYSCHQANYEGTTAVAAMDPAVPDHLSPANVGTYNQQCGDCHNTTTWYSHPEKLFNIKTGSGKHADIQCDTCHLDSTNNSGDAHGANTLCTAQCHFPTETIGAGTMTTGHSDQVALGFNYTTPPAGFTTNNFCLSCHPNGREKPHDETIFPSGHKGDGANCDRCHDRSKQSDAMGLNAPCAPCHLQNGVRVHNQSQGDPTGCLQRGCHFGGGGGDNGG